MKRRRVNNYEATGFGGKKVDASVSIGFSITRGMRRRIKISAAKSDCSMSEWIRRLIEAELKK